MRSLARLAAVLLLASPGAALAQRVQLDISGANFKPLPLAVPEVKGTGDKAAIKEVDEALTQDLAASGIFELLDRKGFLGADKEGMTASSITFQHWLDVGAEGLVKGAVVADAKEVRGQFRLFTVSTGKEELKLDLAAPAENPRRLAHQVANALFKFYTREPGPFETRIAYVKKNGQNKDICVADWDGKHERQLTHGGLNLLPAWSPDGTKVVYTSYKAGNPDLWVFDLAADKASPLVQKGTLITGGAFSPNGRSLAYAQSEGEGSQLWVASPDGTGPRKLTSDYGINSSPSWSPDGARVAFVSNRAGSPQLYVMPAAGGTATRLTYQGNYNQTPDWSPRGDLIAFTARDERNVFDVFTFALEGAKVTRITQDQGTYNEEPTFSPNGRLLMFTSSRSGGSDLIVSTLDGAKQFQLTKGAQISTPAWGPLGK